MLVVVGVLVVTERRARAAKAATKKKRFSCARCGGSCGKKSDGGQHGRWRAPSAEQPDAVRSRQQAASGSHGAGAWQQACKWKEERGKRKEERRRGGEEERRGEREGNDERMATCAAIGINTQLSAANKHHHMMTTIRTLPSCGQCAWG